MHKGDGVSTILGDPGADSGGEGKSKRAGKCGTKKSKERREEPLGIMCYQTSSKRSPTFWLLIGQKNTKVFWHQSAARPAVTVWNWSGKSLSPGALLPHFSSSHFPACLDFPSPPLSAYGSPRMCFNKNSWKKAFFIVKMTGPTMVQPISSEFWKAPYKTSLQIYS